MAAQSRPPILITRPEPQAGRFARLLRGQPWVGKVHCAPLMAPVVLPVNLPHRRWAAVILTSEAAARAARALGLDLPAQAWCVGDRTARVATALGFQATSARGDASSLVRAILTRGQAGPLLHLHGRETTGDVALHLNSAGTETVSVAIYAQEACPLSAAARRLMARPGPILLPVFSSRSAQILVSEWQASDPLATPWLVAISPAVARILTPLAPDKIAVATASDGPAMISALKDLIAISPWA